MTDYSDMVLIQRESYFWTPEYMDVSAWIEHIPFAFWIIEITKPKVVVELGVHYGVSYFAFCQAIKKLNLNTTSYGVDTWKGDEHAGFYTDEIFNKVATYNAREYSRFSTLIRSTFDEAKDYFIDGSVELLHIDGLHTYETVKHDFETWLPKLAKNAIVVFHDINVREREFGVFKLWDELKQKYLHFQFDFGHGLGIISMGKAAANELNILFNENNDGAYYLFLRNLFSDRGRSLKTSFEISLLLNFERNQVKDLRKTCNDLELQQEMYKKSLSESYEKLNAVDQKVEDLNNRLENQHKIIQWYEATFEKRSVFGILKDRLLNKKRI